VQLQCGRMDAQAVVVGCMEHADEGCELALGAAKLVVLRGASLAQKGGDEGPGGAEVAMIAPGLSLEGADMAPKGAGRAPEVAQRAVRGVESAGKLLWDPGVTGEAS
jgi:hypothetical protein